VTRGDRRRLAAAIPLPALGSTVIRAIEAGSSQASPDGGPRRDAEPTVSVGDRSLDNGRVHVEIGDDGSLVLEGGGSRLVGVGRLVDGGDFGDTYNYGPPPTDLLVDTPSVVVIQPIEHGPVRGVLEIVARYDWPVGPHADGSRRSATTAPVEVTTRLELRVGEQFVRIGVSFANPARDHRLRYHVPLAERAERSAAEGQFAVVERGLTAEAGHGEVPTPTFPAHGFVHAAGVSILLEHVTEYELIDGRELALTVLRSTGLISRNENPFREDPAGPEIPVPGAQLVGPWRFGFALHPHAASWSDAGALAAADDFRLPAVIAAGRGDPGLPPATRAGLRVGGHGVVLSALRRLDEGLEIRLVAETPLPVMADLELAGGIARARRVDLVGRPGDLLPVEPDGRIHVPLRAWEVATVLVAGVEVADPVTRVDNATPM
jgi:alpha-mannosidase